MNIQDLGSTGEFIAAIATLVTLVYLASQIRQSTKVAKAQLTKDLFLASRTALMDIAKHPNLAGLAVTHLGADTPEQAQSAAFLNSFFRLYELYFSLAQQGLLDESISQSYERVIRLFTVQKSFQEWWAFASTTEYQGEFVKHINEILEENGS
jgi:hypothetical protein